jgi:hypothetical protein
MIVMLADGGARRVSELTAGVIRDRDEFTRDRLSRFVEGIYRALAGLPPPHWLNDAELDPDTIITLWPSDW